MPDVNTGSLVQLILDSISPLPAGVSGAMIRIVDNQRYFVNQFTGQSIGSVIGETYQSVITDLATAETLRLMAVQDMGVSQVSIGELTTSNDNLFKMAENLTEKAMFQLKALNKGVKIAKVRG